MSAPEIDADAPDRSWFAAYLFCAVVTALPLLSTYRLPSADLPQHAAQMALWRSFHEPCYAFSSIYEINWFTPYLVGYCITRVFAFFLTVNAALKWTIYFAALALPLAALLATRRSRIDPWLALLMFPLAYGFSFYWGFVNFLVAVPIGIAFVILQLRQSDSPEFARALLLAGCGFILAASHALALAVFVGTAGVVHLARSRSVRDFIVGAIPLIIPIPPFLWWMISMRSTEARANAPLQLGIGPHRILEFFQDLLGAAADPEALATAMLIIVVIALSGVRPSRDWRRYVPASCVLAAFLFLPASFFGQIFLHQRFAIAVIPAAFLALDPSTPFLRRRMIRALIVIVVCTWMAVLAARFHRFHRDAEGFDRLVDVMPSNETIALLNLNFGSEAVPGSPFLHFASDYQERKGGINAWSFSNNFPTFIRYKRDARVARIPPIASHHPEFFRWERDATGLDEIIVRAPLDLSSFVFAGHTNEIRLRARAGMWWLYTRRVRSNECAPLERSDASSRRPILDW